MPVRPTLRLSPDDAKIALNSGLLGVDIAQMRRAGPNRPRVRDLLQQRKIRYTRHDPAEHWQTYEEILGQIERFGFALADCEDQATLLAAELQVDGLDPDAAVDVYRTGANVSHVVVSSPRYGRLDPSEWSGMGWDEPSEGTAAQFRVVAGLPGDPDGLNGPAVPYRAPPARYPPQHDALGASFLQVLGYGTSLHPNGEDVGR